MPKEKKLTIRGQNTRHAPLGQVIQEDENRGRYATIRSRPRGGATKSLLDDENENEFLDEKISRKIFDMSKEQQLELEAEEQLEARRKIHKVNKESSDEEDNEVESVMDNGDMDE